MYKLIETTHSILQFFRLNKLALKIQIWDMNKAQIKILQFLENCQPYEVERTLRNLDQIHSYLPEDKRKYKL